MPHYEYSISRIVYVGTLECTKNKAYYVSPGFRVWKCARVSLFIICKKDLVCRDSFLSRKDFSPEAGGQGTARTQAGKQGVENSLCSSFPFIITTDTRTLVNFNLKIDFVFKLEVQFLYIYVC